MKITVSRNWPRAGYIIGKMLINGEFLCNTLEPPAVGRVHPAIPAGTYKVRMYPSARFKGVRPMICDVPGRSAILIHEGNSAADTLGCILVGINDRKGWVSQSKSYLNRLIKLINSAIDNGEDITIDII